MEQLGPIITALALLVTAVGGLTLRRSAREKELALGMAEAEKSAHRRLKVLRRVQVWLIDSRVYDDLPDTLRLDLERESDL